jgi:hypothetical protein
MDSLQHRPKINTIRHSHAPVSVLSRVRCSILICQAHVPFSHSLLPIPPYFLSFLPPPPPPKYPPNTKYLTPIPSRSHVCSVTLSHSPIALFSRTSPRRNCTFHLQLAAQWIGFDVLTRPMGVREVRCAEQGQAWRRDARYLGIRKRSVLLR